MNELERLKFIKKIDTQISDKKSLETLKEQLEKMKKNQFLSNTSI